MNRRRLLLTCLIASSALAGLGGAAEVPQALAASYEVESCSNGPNNAYTYSSTAGILTGDAICPASSNDYSGISVLDRLGGGSELTYGGASAYWTLTPPGGLRISKVSARTWLFNNGGDADLLPELRTGEGQILSTCVIQPEYNFCANNPPNYSVPDVYSGLDASSVSVGVRCIAEPGVRCVGGFSIHRIVAVLYDSVVTIEDPVAPTVGAASGSLFAGGWLRGEQTAGAPASDTSGIRRERVVRGGVEYGNTELSCDFSRVRPCADAQTAPQVSVDTREWPDGISQVRVGAFDAADNRSLSAPREVKVDNSAPASPAGLTLNGGEDPSTAESLSAVWQLPPADAGSPVVGARWELCLVGQESCTTGQTTDTSVSFPVEARHYEFRVWLLDEAGNADRSTMAAKRILFNRPTPPPPAPPADPLPGNDSVLTPPPSSSTASSSQPTVAMPPTGSGGPVAAQPAGSPTRASVSRSSVRLRVSGRARRGRASLLVRTGSRRATGTVRVTVESRKGSRRLSRRTRTVRLRKGSGRLVLRVPAAATRLVVRARYGGDARYRPASAPTARLRA